MEPLHLEAGNRSPKVSFDPHSGLFVLAGRSIPENALDLYAPVLTWVRAYVNAPAAHTHLEFKLSYFNSSSTEYLLEMFQLLKSVSEKGKRFTCKWYREADDEDMEQIAQDFMVLTNMQFELAITLPAADIEQEDY